MGLKGRALCMTFIIIISMIIVIYFISDIVFLKSFRDLEEKNVRVNVKRVENMIQNQMDELHCINRDWAPWDDTYRFIHEKNREYIQGNLLDEVFENLQINMIVFLDNKNNIIFSKGFDLQQNQEVAIPQKTKEALLENSILTSHKNEQDGKKGILLLPEGSLLVVSHPIVTSEFKGPIRGTLVMGRYLSEEQVNQIAKTLQLSVRVHHLNSSHLSPEIRSIQGQLINRDSILVLPIDKNSVKGYSALKDIVGKPAVIVEVEKYREVYKQGQISRNYFLLLLVGVCFVFSILVFVFMEKLILIPSGLRDALLNTIPALVYFKDENLKYIIGNKILLDTFHLSQREIKGMTDFDLLPLEDAKICYEEDIEMLQTGKYIMNQERLITKPNGEKLWISKSKAVYRNDCGQIKGIVGIGLDITEKKKMEERIQFLAYYDSLTQLPNRIFLQHYMEEKIKEYKVYNRKFSVLYIDLDRFKMINDTLGHHAGDFFLKDLSKKLKKCIRSKDVVSRLGGDEFVIILSEVSAEEEVILVCQRILEMIQKPWEIEQHEFYVTASIGISMYPNDGEDVEALLKHADIAMYNVKESGKNNYAFYEPSLSIEALQEVDLESSLRSALLKEEFLIYYQLKVHCQTEEIIGMEALLRWQHPILGLLQPKSFISVAEKSKLILPVGEWVLRTVCCQVKEWQMEGYAKLKISINIATLQLEQSNFVEGFKEIVEELQLDCSWLEIEISESILMRNQEFILKNLQELKKMGVQIALDDLGVGSSLSYLKYFPIDRIKIDKCFIDDVLNAPEDTAIVKTIIYLSKAMGLGVVAEGVETEEQLRFLKLENCDELQGYLFSEPVPKEIIIERLNFKGTHS